MTLRLGLAAVLLLVVCRPTLRGYGRTDWAVVITFGTALAGMNLLFYEAIDRIPLGAAVTLEVLGPLALAVFAGRRAASWLWAALALVGVILLGRGGFSGLNVAGVAFALGAAGLWAGYILLSARTGRRFPQMDGLALALTVGAVVILPFGALTAGPALLAPTTLGLGAVVAVLSAALPFSLELLSLRKLPAATFAILTSSRARDRRARRLPRAAPGPEPDRVPRHCPGDRRIHRCSPQLPLLCGRRDVAAADGGQLVERCLIEVTAQRVDSGLHLARTARAHQHRRHSGMPSRERRCGKRE